MSLKQLVIENAPEIPGLSFRPFRGDADFEPMAAVLTESQRADQYERVVNAEDLEKAYATSLTNCDPTTDMIMAEVAGEMVGYVRGWWEQESTSMWLCHHSGFLLPAWRRKGIGRAMLGWMENHLKDIAQAHACGSKQYFQVSVSQFQEGAGYLPGRYFLEMVRPNLEGLTDFSLPDGLEIRPVKPDQYRTIWDSAHDSGQEEWGEPEPTENAYQVWLKDALFQPDLWQIAWDKATGQPAGHVLTYIHHAENKQFNRKRGYTEGVGVSREWRRRGVARALISRSLRVQKSAGMSESALVADCDSKSGITGLYESCGFQIVKRDTIYRKLL
jgi:mycothiol synthase